MKQLAERERVKARIRTLLARTTQNGCTEAEALAAAEMVGRLLQHYALTMDEVALRQTPCVQRSVAWPGIRRRPIDCCIPALARFCDCKVWIQREDGKAAYVFFGMEQDVSLALYLHDVILRSIASESLMFRENHRHLQGAALAGAQRRYQAGMATRVAERLEALRRTLHDELHRQHSQGRALILAKDQTVEAAFKATTIRLVKGRGQVIRADHAYRDGYAAGDRVNLNRPLRQQDASLLR